MGYVNPLEGIWCCSYCYLNFGSFHDRVSSHRDQLHDFATQRWGQLKEPPKQWRNTSTPIVHHQMCYSNQEDKERNNKYPTHGVKNSSNYHKKQQKPLDINTFPYFIFGSLTARCIWFCSSEAASESLLEASRSPTCPVEIWGFKGLKDLDFFELFSTFFFHTCFFFRIFFHVFFVSWVFKLWRSN